MQIGQEYLTGINAMLTSITNIKLLQALSIQSSIQLLLYIDNVCINVLIALNQMITINEGKKIRDAIIKRIRNREERRWRVFPDALYEIDDEIVFLKKLLIKIDKTIIL